MLSPDGRCKTFDASANGYVRGSLRDPGWNCLGVPAVNPLFLKRNLCLVPRHSFAFRKSCRLLIAPKILVSVSNISSGFPSPRTWRPGLWTGEGSGSALLELGTQGALPLVAATASNQAMGGGFGGESPVTKSDGNPRWFPIRKWSTVIDDGFSIPYCMVT